MTRQDFIRFALPRRLCAIALSFPLMLGFATSASAQPRQHEDHEGHEDNAFRKGHDDKASLIGEGSLSRDLPDFSNLRDHRDLRVVFPEQTRKPTQPTRRPARPREPIGIRGVGLIGANFFTATESFDAVLGSRSGPIFGGGVQVTFPMGLYVEAAAWRFSADGERVFVGPDDEVFPLGIATTIKVTPFEITGGWRFRNLSRRIVPYAGGGVNWHRYEETAEFAQAGDDVDERFTGYHIVGGVEAQLHRWIHVAGEVGWSSVPDALGGGGVSAAFDEDNLGGTSVRFKILVGR